MSFAAVSASGLQTLIPGTHHRNVSVLLTRPSAWFCPLQENVELLECSAVSYAAQGNNSARVREKHDGSLWFTNMT